MSAPMSAPVPPTDPTAPVAPDAPPPVEPADRAAGLLLVATTALVTLAEWGAGEGLRDAACLTALGLLAILATGVRLARRVFVLVGLGLFAADVALREDWLGPARAALASAAFIAAFFTTLASLRTASACSPAIAVCGRFLATQPPGRRYLALTVGGGLFALILNYGALVLLGGLAEANARREQNPEIRRHRTRRMLLAIQRGFVSTLPWSPLAFAMAVTTALVPGSSWAAAVGPCLVSGLILASLGWALDTVLKPRLSVPAPPRGRPEGSWASLWPLLLLLAIIVLGVGGVHVATGIRVVGVVMLLVPLLALGWVWLQARGGGVPVAARVGGYVTRDLPAYRGELVLLMMAGVIGTLGAAILAPVVAASGLDLAALPLPAVLLGLLWIVPVAGQLGMNPILSVSLLAPLLPEAAALGTTPTAIIAALTAGWALSGASSPFTATTLLIGAMGGVSATHVGLRWNGLYTLLGGTLLSAWVLAVAALGL